MTGGFFIPESEVRSMEIKIVGAPKEIADFVLQLQSQREEKKPFVSEYGLTAEEIAKKYYSECQRSSG